MALSQEEATRFNAALDLISQIAVTNQDLLDLFRAGGVSNADWAVMKAELQSWTTTQLGGYVSLSGSQTITGNKTFSGNTAISTPQLNSDTASAINIDFLNNTGNSVVHKSGNELIEGLKKFTYLVSCDPTKDLTTIQTNESMNFGLTFADSRGYSYPLGSIVYQKTTTDRCAIVNYVHGKSKDNNNNYTSAFTRLCVDSDDTTKYLIEVGTTKTRNIVPIANNTYSLGDSNTLWVDVFASTGVIQTSDKSLKTEINDIPEAAMRAWSKVKFKQFKFKDAVTKKGADARIHIGVIANEDVDSIQKAFQSEGLNARDYGLFCYDEWEDQYEDEQVLVKPEVREQVKVVDAQAMYNTVFKEDGTEEQVLVSPEESHMEEQVIEEAVYKTEKKLVTPAGSRYSVRYEECLALECAYQRWRLEQLEARIGQ